MTLFAEQVRTAPRSAKAHIDYGLVPAQAKRDREALAAYETALANYPDHPRAWYGKSK